MHDVISMIIKDLDRLRVIDQLVPEPKKPAIPFFAHFLHNNLAFSNCLVSHKPSTIFLRHSSLSFPESILSTHAIKESTFSRRMILLDEQTADTIKHVDTVKAEEAYSIDVAIALSIVQSSL